ncbi:MAG: hypothetical protein LJE65_09300, partial [Desulfobacteraceae bacterium]|nr:hypothetical protein [Desulfobacteraceae bacterium]
YDSDDAGIKAARRSIAVFDRGFVDAHILVLPPGHDPDTFLNREGRQAFEKQVEKAQPMISFVIASAVERHGATPKGKARIVREVQSVLASVQDRVERSLYTKELAERIGVRESDIVVEMRRTGRTGRSRAGSPRKPPDPYERQIVTMMVHLPEIIPVVQSLNPLAYFRNEALEHLARAILDSPERPAEAIDRAASEAGGEIARLAAEIAVADDAWSFLECDRLVHRFVEHRRKKRDYSRIDSELRAAEQAHDEVRITQLLAEKQKLAEALEKEKTKHIRQVSDQR